MEGNDNIELIQLAIQRLIEEKKNRGISSGASFIAEDDDDDDDQILLSRLFSQLESIKGDGVLHKHELPREEMGVNYPGVGEVKKKSEAVGEGDDASSIELRKDDIVKELRKLKKQNLITHCLLSVMIVITLAWQLSEVSLILKVKKGLTNPFSSFGDMLNGMFKGPRMIVHDGNKESSSSAKQAKIEVPSIPPLKIPELPQMDLSSLGLDGDED